MLRFYLLVHQQLNINSSRGDKSFDDSLEWYTHIRVVWGTRYEICYWSLKLSEVPFANVICVSPVQNVVFRVFIWSPVHLVSFWLMISWKHRCTCSSYLKYKWKFLWGLLSFIVLEHFLKIFSIISIIILRTITLLKYYAKQ